MHQMLLAMRQLAERQRASAPVNPVLLTEAEKNAHILACQARIAELDSIGQYLVNTIQAIRQAAEEPVIDKTLILKLCEQVWDCAVPANGILVQPDTGAATVIRKAL